MTLIKIAPALAALVLALAVVALRLSGGMLLVVTGGSMEPTIHKGSLVLVQPVSPEAVRVGDVVTFVAGGDATTHRVLGTAQTPAGRAFTTKGDANPVADPEPKIFFTSIGLVRGTMPLLGYGAVYAQAYGKLALALVAAATFLLSLLRLLRPLGAAALARLVESPQRRRVRLYCTVSRPVLGAARARRRVRGGPEMGFIVSIRPDLAGRAIVLLLLSALVFTSATAGRTAASFSAVSGNPNNAVATLSVQPPSLSGAASAAGGVINLGWSASITAPGSGHALSYIVLRGPVGGPYAQIGTTSGSTLAYSDTPPSDGTYGYVVQTKVSGGGSFTSAGSTSRSAVSDRTAPALAITCDGSACSTAWYTAAVSVTVTGTDAGTGMGTVTRSVDGGAPSTTAGATATFAVGGDSAGHSVGYSGTDAAGNASATAAQTIRIDGTAPSTVTGLTSAQGTKGGVATVNLSWSAATDALSGLQGYEVRWSNAVATCPAVGTANYPNSTTVGAVTTAVIPPTGSLTTGSKYCAYLVTIDNAGNRSLASAPTGPATAR